MGELTLVGLHDDGEHIVLEGPDGQRFRLPIDESLRAAVRRDRPGLEQVRAGERSILAPREIQARIRAGATAEEVAEQSGATVESVRRYEGPVLAEREWIAQQARGTRIGHEMGAPTLGDLAADRLATRGVVQDTIRWDSARDGSGPWMVDLSFEISDARRSARWTFDATARTLRALDDEARWLSETELADEPIPRRHLSAVRSSVFDVEVDDALRPLLAAIDTRPADFTPPAVVEHVPATPTPAETTAALLDDLQGRRGVRQPLLETEDDEPDDEEFEGFGPQHAFDFERPGATQPVPGAHPPDSRPDLATDATVLEMPRRAAPDEHLGELGGERPGPGGATAAAPSTHGSAGPAGGPATAANGPDASPRPRARRGRASVPTWDEIVFGAKPE